MVHYLANKTAEYIADGDETADVEVIRYGYYLVYQEWIVNIAFALVALPFGLFFHALAAVLSVRLIRSRAGGTHARHSYVCRITSFVIVFLPIILAVAFPVVLSPLVFLLYPLGFAALFVYAPAETNYKKVNDPKERKSLKVGALVNFSVLFLIAAALWSWFPEISFAIVGATIFACTAVLPVMYRVYGFDPVTREEMV